MQVEVIYEDNHLLILNKPAGWPSQGDKTGDPSMIDMASAYIRDRYDKPGKVFVGLAHRIDRPVSGLLMLCKTSKSLSRMTQAFKARTVQKAYLSIVEGVFEHKTLHLDHFMVKNGRINKSRVVPEGTPRAKQALLDIECIANTSTHSLLKLHPITGRSHQLRTQLSHIGHPIVGDVKYGAKRHDDRRAICLHSTYMAFEHPTTKEKVSLASQPHHGHWKRFGTLLMHCD